MSTKIVVNIGMCAAIVVAAHFGSATVEAVDCEGTESVPFQWCDPAHLKDPVLNPMSGCIFVPAEGCDGSGGCSGTQLQNYVKGKCIDGEDETSECVADESVATLIRVKKQKSCEPAGGQLPCSCIWKDLPPAQQDPQPVDVCDCGGSAS